MSKTETSTRPTLVLYPRDKNGKIVEGASKLVKQGKPADLWNWMNQVTPKCLKKGEPWESSQ
jgi:hypothetical protein